MGMPVIDLKGLEGDERVKTMEQLKDAAENWGFFQIVNHGMPEDLMEKMKRLTHEHHDRNLQPPFDDSEVVKRLLDADEEELRDVDWETVFFVQHLPFSTVHQVPNLSHDLLEVMGEYEKEMMKLAERMLDLFCENMGLEKGYLKKAFSGPNGLPFMGTKFARYPSCLKAHRIDGLRKHYDAGGIILVLQDDIPGLQFYKGGEWVDVVPLEGSIFVNTGDQLEVLTNGRIKSIAHRVIAQEHGGRISIAAFYNPASDAVISPAPELLYPENYVFSDYMKIYSGTKFGEKQPRLDFLKERGGEPIGELHGLVY